MNRAEWLEARRQCITGTDIAAILGRHPYKTQHDVWLEKMGLSDEVEPNEAMRWGTILEPVVAARFAELRGVELTKGEFIKDETRPFGGTPDFVLPDGAILEIKTGSSYRSGEWGDPGTDDIPPHYLLQVAWYLMLSGAPVGHVAVLLGGQDYREYRVNRDRELESILVNRASKWWADFVIGNVEPPFTGTAKDDEYLTRKFAKNSDQDVIEADPEAREAIASLYSARGEKEKWEAVETAAIVVLKSKIGEHSGIQAEGLGKITWRCSKDSEKTDWEGMAKQLIAEMEPNCQKQLLSQYTIAKLGSRRFLAKFDKRGDE